MKRIRIHDLRHSHISLLIEMGFSAVAIADRVGHESIDITYRYAHLFPSTQNEMADRLSDLRSDDAEEVIQMSAKNLDSKGRSRSRTIGFRVSPEEEKLINSAVALSGLTKQDYIVKRLLCRDVVVQGNPRVYKALKNQLAEVLTELQRIKNSSVSDELLETIRLINTTLNGMKGES